MSRLDEMYEKVDLAFIQQLWKAVDHDVHVYIHNPFCQSICKYCFYKGILQKNNDLQRYYFEYLPQRIDDYSEVLASNNIRSYFFGGGTPTLMNPEMMRTVFSRIPNFKDVESKLMEVHPASWSEEKIDLLQEYNFNAIIVGIQTFNEGLLKQQNRSATSPAEVERLVGYAKSKGLYVLCDLMVYMEAPSIQSVNNFSNDLKIVSTFDVDEISANANYNFVFSADTVFGFGATTIEEAFIKVLQQFLKENPQYKWQPEDFRSRTEAEEDSQDKMSEYKGGAKVMRLVKKSISADYFFTRIFPQLEAMDELKMDTGAFNSSVLGLGSFKNPCKNTFSIIGRDIEYIEVNDGDFVPTYYVVYNGSKQRSFCEMTREFLDEIEELGPVPNRFQFKFFSVVNSIDDYTLYPKKERRLVIDVSYGTKSEEVQSYLNKLEKRYPTWKLDN